MSDYKSTSNLATLAIRADLLKRTRAFFDERQFIEVQTPLLSADTVVDRHVDPVPVLLPDGPFELNSGRQMWLQTSPEFAMKRLLASGANAIYQITPAFRIGESGDQHNPEFTMLEWYRCGDSYLTGIQLLADFISELLNLGPANVATVSDRFVSLAGFDPLRCSTSELRSHCETRGVSIPHSVQVDDWDTHFDLLFTELVQPQLGVSSPTIMNDYPASQAALAEIRDGEPSVAERFELFVKGIELANGYHELLDAEELSRRNVRTNQLRVADGKAVLPVESRLLEAMRSDLPACVGVALGFDRLVMLATGATSIRDVLTFPTDIS